MYSTGDLAVSNLNSTKKSAMNIAPVSIVIPNYNGEPILAKTLASVVEAVEAYPGESEIIIVDDASQDRSIPLITNNFPGIKVVQHNTNKGFAETVHSGIKLSNYPINILLNSDVRPNRNFIAPLVRWFSKEDTFSVSPLILDQHRKPLRVSWNLGKIVRGEIRKRNWDLEDAFELARRGRTLKSLYASGGSIAIRKEIFFQLGGFLPLYKPFYYEDRDLCTRAWRRGWKTYFEPESTVVHDHQGTIKRFFPVKRIKIIKRRNRFFYLWLHLSTRKLIFFHIPWIFFRLFLRLLQLDILYAIALFNALLSLGEVFGQRSRLNRELGIKSLEKILDEISH